MKALKPVHAHKLKIGLRLIHKEGLMEAALDQQGMSLGPSTYASVFNICRNLKELKQIHSQLFISGLDQNINLETKLVSMYAMYGSMENARLVFDKICGQNAFLWNVMIRGYATNGPCEKALALYYQMQQSGIEADTFTFNFVLKACAGLSALEEGKEIHDHIARIGFESDYYVGNSLVAMYCKCGRMELARRVFDKMPKRDVVSWNEMISGYATNGLCEEALILYNQMQQSRIEPDSFTLNFLLKACAGLSDLEQGKEIHHHVVRAGFESVIFVGNSLLAMYAKCGNVEDARHLFNTMSKRDLVSWNTMICGYAHNGHANEALTLFNQMQLEGIKPNTVTLASVLPACAHLAALQLAKWMHGYIIRSGFESNVFVGTALIDLYAKCGSIDIAHQVFDKLSKRNVVSWSAMIAGYGMHGHGEAALALFGQMQQTGVKPDQVTFVCLLSACSHAGLVDEGWQYFDCMIRDHCITPRMDHYACMVDLLGRAGCLDEAEDFIKKMPLEPSAKVWGALLGACSIHCNIELGERVAKQLFALDPKNAGRYVLLSNIYAAAGRWNDVIKVRAMMKERGLKKTPGCSLIEVNNRVHAFLVGDRSHPQTEKIYAMLETLAGQMKDAGYVPNTNYVLHDVEEEVKEHLLGSHSEKLAIAFGLINTSPGTPIRITKNLRVCGDCHSATKYISKVVRREIVVRDANRFHVFKDGICSCGDYW
eukprot:Gb_21824 [translate_table: standard]